MIKMEEEKKSRVLVNNDTDRALKEDEDELPLMVSVDMSHDEIIEQMQQHNDESWVIVEPKERLM